MIVNHYILWDMIEKWLSWVCWFAVHSQGVCHIKPILDQVCVCVCDLGNLEPSWGAHWHHLGEIRAKYIPMSQKLHNKFNHAQFWKISCWYMFRHWSLKDWCILSMGVSKNNDIPKSSILIGFSIINHPFWGTPIFGNTHIPNPTRSLQMCRPFLTSPEPTCCRCRIPRISVPHIPLWPSQESANWKTSLNPVLPFFNIA